MSKQTVVEWLVEQIEKDENVRLRGLIISNLLDQAKQMEKEQMWDYINKKYCIGDKSLEFHKLEFEDFYNETYGGTQC